MILIYGHLIIFKVEKFILDDKVSYGGQIFYQGQKMIFAVAKQLNVLFKVRKQIINFHYHFFLPVHEGKTPSGCRG